MQQVTRCARTALSFRSSHRLAPQTCACRDTPPPGGTAVLLGVVPNSEFGTTPANVYHSSHSDEVRHAPWLHSSQLSSKPSFGTNGPALAEIHPPAGRTAVPGGVVPNSELGTAPANVCHSSHSDEVRHAPRYHRIWGNTPGDRRAPLGVCVSAQAKVRWGSATASTKAESCAIAAHVLLHRCGSSGKRSGAFSLILNLGQHPPGTAVRPAGGCISAQAQVRWC